MGVTFIAGVIGGCGRQTPSFQEGSSAVSQEESSAPELSEEESRPEAGNITVTDHAGREVELPAQINRVVVTDIYPMASVLTVFLGSAEKLVGIHPSA